MSFTPNGAYFQELGGSPTIEFNMQGISGTRKFWVPHTTDLMPFLQEVVGVWVIQGQQQSNNNTGGSCFFQPPMSFPGFPAVVPTDVTVNPKMPDSPEGTFPVGIGHGDATNDYLGGWEVNVKYETIYNPVPNFEYQLPTGTYLSYEADLGAEMMDVPGIKFYWMISPTQISTDANNDPKPVGGDVTVPIRIPTGNYTLVWDRVIAPPWTTIRQTRGKVNGAPFLGAPAGTVLFLGAQLAKQFQFNPYSGFWRVEYKFAERSTILNSGTEVGWNYFFCGEGTWGSKDNGGQTVTENWLTVTSDPGKPNAQGGPFTSPGGSTLWIPLFDDNWSYQPPYPLADFSQLFQFDPSVSCKNP